MGASYSLAGVAADRSKPLEHCWTLPKQNCSLANSSEMVALTDSQGVVSRSQSLAKSL